MKLFSLLFALATALFYQLADIPSIWWLPVLIMLTVLALRFFSPSAGFFLGFICALLYTIVNHPPHIENLNIRSDYLLSGTVVSIPHSNIRRTKFVFELDSANTLVQPNSSLTLNVSWRFAPEIKVGQRWRLTLRIKPISGLRNPGGWDYEKYRYFQNIKYTAYVKSGTHAEALAEEPCCWLARIRENLISGLMSIGLSEKGGAVVSALTVGDRSGFTSDLRTLFIDTGIMHLIAISGLHIGMIAGLVFMLVDNAWRRIPSLCRNIPAKVAASFVGLVAALIYALISGFGLPAQRALIMLTVFFIALLLRRRIDHFDALAFALLLVLILAPYSITNAGLWLSFAAVATIFALIPRIRKLVWWQSLLFFQLILSVSLVPILWAFGMPVSLLGPLINIILVPLFTFAVVPIALLGLLLFSLQIDDQGRLLKLSDEIVQYLLEGIEYVLEIFTDQTVYVYISDAESLILALVVIMALSPFARIFRLVAVFLVVMMFMPRAQHLHDAEFELTMLDAGQGTNIVIKTKNHVLVYDLGPAFNSGYSAVNAAVLPYLKAANIDYIDALVISHGDQDHVGAYSTFIKSIDVAAVFAGEPGRKGVEGEQCATVKPWRWDGVDFKFISITGRSSGNNASCILEVSNGRHSALITGDIEARVEIALIRSGLLKPQYAIVSVPHHGSASSSTEDFVNVLQAEYALFSVGAYNRYGFPKPKIWDRWIASGSNPIRSDKAGATSFVVTLEDHLSKPTLFREANKRIWHSIRN